MCCLLFIPLAHLLSIHFSEIVQQLISCYIRLDQEYKLWRHHYYLYSRRRSEIEKELSLYQYAEHYCELPQGLARESPRSPGLHEPEESGCIVLRLILGLASASSQTSSSLTSFLRNSQREGQQILKS